MNAPLIGGVNRMGVRGRLRQYTIGALRDTTRRPRAPENRWGRAGRTRTPA